MGYSAESDVAAGTSRSASATWRSDDVCRAPARPLSAGTVRISGHIAADALTQLPVYVIPERSSVRIWVSAFELRLRMLGMFPWS